MSKPTAAETASSNNSTSAKDDANGESADRTAGDTTDTHGATNPTNSTGPTEGRRLSRWLAIVLAVVSSAAVLVLELTSVRLAAPFVGDTFQTYTASIGVALAAIALGAGRGGWAADRFSPHRMLGPLLIIGGLLTLACRPIVLLLGQYVNNTGPVGSVLLIAIGAAAPMAVLSAVPPIVVKTQLRRLDAGGEVVGRFSALGTLGGLAGTFLTGFVLLATLPVSAILITTGAVLLVLGVFLLFWAGRSGLLKRGPVAIGGVLALLATTTGSVATPSPCDYESAYYCARVTADPVRPTGRVLWLDDARHSYVDIADPRYLDFEYTQRYGSIIDAMAAPGKPLRGLHVGGGGFTMPRYLTATRPGSTSKVLEVDPVVVRLGREKLALRTSANLRVEVGDARVNIRSEPASGYDLVVGDAFGSTTVPWHLATVEFTREIKRTLRPGGVYMLNVIDYPPLNLLAAELATVRAVFGSAMVLGTSAELAGGEGGNFVIVAGGGSPDRATLAAAAARRPGGEAVSTPAQVTALTKGSRPLTDDNAPVDQLITPYIMA